MGGGRTRAIVAMLATAAMAVLSGTAWGDLAKIERFAGVAGEPMAAGPDGRLWLLGRQWPAGVEVRADELRVALVSGADVQVATELTPLADGSMAYVGQLDVRRRVLVRVRPGAPAAVTPLPNTVSYGPAAIAADGTVWIDDVCAQRLLRIAPDGRRFSMPVPAGDCERKPEAYPMVAVGGDGAAWVAHLCVGRILRVPLVGPPRLWHVLRRDEMCSVSSAGVRPLHVRLRPTAAGGVRFPGGTIDARGRARSRPWLPFPDVLTSIAGPDRRRWFVRADYAWSPWEESGWNVRLGARGAGRRREEQLLPPFGTAPEQGTMLAGYPTMAAAPDGSVWLSMSERVEGTYVVELMRAVPVPPLDPAPPAPAPTARVLARRGPVVWLQLACAARSGSYCTGDARLMDGRGAATPFAVPGGDARPVRVVLGEAQRRLLRAVGHVRLDVLVRSGDATAQRHLPLTGREAS